MTIFCETEIELVVKSNFIKHNLKILFSKFERLKSTFPVFFNSYNEAVSHPMLFISLMTCRTDRL